MVIQEGEAVWTYGLPDRIYGEEALVYIVVLLHSYCSGGWDGL